MNVFVLCTGRCGSTTFVKACSHISNYSSGHESRNRILGRARFAYPENHVEADNRLSWFLGRLDQAYGDTASYVHLTRDPDEVAKSFETRWRSIGQIAPAYREGILAGARISRRESSRDMIDTISANIELFLKDKSRVMRIDLATAAAQFGEFWQWIGAEGDRDAALAEWSVPHNAGGLARRPLATAYEKAWLAYRAAFPRR